MYNTTENDSSSTRRGKPQPISTEAPDTMPDIRDLSEVERQQHYLQKLPKGYNFPLFSGRRAVESQRQSGYKDTARAAREIVDNAIEAGAKNVWIALDRVTEGERKKGQSKERVSAIAFIDDGPGMLPDMARFALTWGGGTHADAPEGIGKFGFGLPNASINQTRRVSVYTKTADADGWVKATLDINAVDEYGLVTVDAPIAAEVPDFVQKFLRRNRVTLSSGTVVVWEQPDRLSWSRATMLKEHLKHDFGVVYRYMLDTSGSGASEGPRRHRAAVYIEDDRVGPVDPLFLMPEGMFYVPPEQGGAIKALEKKIVVALRREPGSGTPHLDYLETADAVAEARAEPGTHVGIIVVKIGRFPVGFVLGLKKHRGTDGYKRWEFRKDRRGMSFVRADREIETVDVFPKSTSAVSEGLGDWPLLQGYAYHWGIEVSFTPDIDEAMRVGNDKQTIRPIEDFWRVMTKAGVDAAARAEAAYQRAEREDKDAKEAQEELSESRPTLATEAAAQAEKLTGRKRLPASSREEAEKRTREAVEKKQAEAKTDSATTDEARESATGTEPKAGASANNAVTPPKATPGTGPEVTPGGASPASPEDAALAAIEEEARRQRFFISKFHAEGGAVYRPSLGNGHQIGVEVNTAHPFFRSFYVDLKAKPRARYAVDLLLLTLAKAEAEADGERKTFYEQERKYNWTQFLDACLSVLDQLEDGALEEEQDSDA
jgi:hypothetical protein